MYSTLSEEILDGRYSGKKFCLVNICSAGISSLILRVFSFMHFCPGTMTTQAESINSDLQRGLDRRFTIHTTLSREQNQLAIKVSAVKYWYRNFCEFKSRQTEPAGLEPAALRCWVTHLSKYVRRPQPLRHGDLTYVDSLLLND